MDSNLNLHRFAGFKAFSRRLSKLSKSRAAVFKIDWELSQAAKKVLLGLAFIGMASLVGYWAKVESERISLQHWKAENSPSMSVWNFTLVSMGFQELKNSSAIQKIYRTLPITFESQHLFWMTKNSEWLVLFQDADAIAPPRIFTRHKPEPKSKALTKLIPSLEWIPHGAGWLGFQEVLDKLAALAHSPQHHPLPTHSPRRAFFDPREIRY